MDYVIYATREGSPATGLSPYIDVYVKVSDGTLAGVVPIVSELESGFYKFTAIPTEPVIVRINMDDPSMTDRDMLIPMIISPPDAYVDAAISDVKDQTDKLVFTVDGDVAASLDGEEVNLLAATQTQIDNTEGHASDIKGQTDKLAFSLDSDVLATLNGEEVNLLAATQIQVDNTESYASDIKGQTDLLEFTGNDVHATLAGEQVDLLPTTAEAVADAVWEEARAGHVAPGSFGAVSEWSSAGSSLDPDEVAAAVWDAPRDEHEEAGSFGAILEWAGTGTIDPDSIAAAVWNALSTTYGTPGTMGWLQNLIDNGVIRAPRLVPGE